MTDFTAWLFTWYFTYNRPDFLLMLDTKVCHKSQHTSSERGEKEHQIHRAFSPQKTSAHVLRTLASHTEPKGPCPSSLAMFWWSGMTETVQQDRLLHLNKTVWLCGQNTALLSYSRTLQQTSTDHIKVDNVIRILDGYNNKPPLGTKHTHNVTNEMPSIWQRDALVSRGKVLPFCGMWEGKNKGC